MADSTFLPRTKAGKSSDNLVNNGDFEDVPALQFMNDWAPPHLGIPGRDITRIVVQPDTRLPHSGLHSGRFSAP